MRALVAYDGSSGAATALRAALRLFPSARMSLVNVPPVSFVHAASRFPSDPTLSAEAVQQAVDAVEDQAQRQAREAAQQGVDLARAAGREAEVVGIPSAAPAWRAILATAREIGADAVVCGTRGRGAFARALLGSTSTGLLHNADVPLLVVPEGSGELDGPAVIAYDGSDSAKHGIEVVARLMDGRPVVIAHAWDGAVHRGMSSAGFAAMAEPAGDLLVHLLELLEEEAEAITRAGVDAARAAGLEATGDTIRTGEGAWRSVAGAARTHGAAAIVTGARGLGAARSALLGSVSSGLVQNAELPILVVPAAASRAG